MLAECMDLSNDYKGRVSNDHNLWTDCNRMQQNQTPYLSIHAIPLQAPPVAQACRVVYRGEEQTLLHELQVVLVEAVTVPFSVSSNAVSFGTRRCFPTSPQYHPSNALIPLPTMGTPLSHPPSRRFRPIQSKL